MLSSSIIVFTAKSSLIRPSLRALVTMLVAHTIGNLEYMTQFKHPPQVASCSYNDRVELLIIGSDKIVSLIICELISKLLLIDKLITFIRVDMIKVVK